MSRIFAFLLILLIAIPVFAQEEEEEYSPLSSVENEFDTDEYVQEEISPLSGIEDEFVVVETVADEPVTEEIVTEEYVVPQSIRNNQFYRESLRLSKLAHDTYEYGDYEASAGFAEEAIYNAQLSDEFVSTQLLAEAKRLVDWAEFYNIADKNPNNVKLGKDHYENAVALHSEEEWNESSDFSIKAIEVLGVLLAGTGATASNRPTTSGTTLGSSSGSFTYGSGSNAPATTGTSANRSQYTVRTWAVEKDCFWNIAGYEWVYGDVWQWRKLYEANKNKIPDPNNPDLVEPGTVLDIPR